MVDPSVRCKLLKMFISLKPVAVDARKSVNRADDIWMDIATLFNNNEWKPKFTIFTNLHPDSMYTYPVILLRGRQILS
jgi:hypothetical protein